MATPRSLSTSPPPGTNGKQQKSPRNSLVMTSLSQALDPALSVALRDNKPSMNEENKKMRLPELLVPRTNGSGLDVKKERKKKYSSRSDDDSPSPTSPTLSTRRLSPLFRKKKFKSRPIDGKMKNASSTPILNVINPVIPVLSVIETTPVDSLPGQPSSSSSQQQSRPPMVPTILVSPDQEECSLIRKTSQCSHLSAASSTLTSGALSIGSLLSPSGDEECISDQESPLSPLSNASSIGGSHEFMGPFDDDTLSSSPPGTDGDDFIETDFTPSSPSHYSPTATKQVLAIPSTNPNTTTNKGGAKLKKKKWSVIRKAVAWSPFVQVYRKKYPWVQLAGHQGNFSPGEENGTIIKKSSADEARALRLLMDDVVKPYVPEYKREFNKDGELYIEMDDLLRDFDNPCVMDIKMGTRTYLEDELVKAKVKEALRPDMYEKMIAVDPNEPTPEEHEAKAITKPRYMVWRETLSSTATLGFRIEGIKMSKDKPMKEEFKTVRCREDVHHHLKKFVKKHPEPKRKLLEKLHEMRSRLEKSEFFAHHEVIGSSLLFVYDSHNQASVNIIDFGKTVPLPEGHSSINHRDSWVEGNHEDGYLFGLDNLIEIWETL